LRNTRERILEDVVSKSVQIVPARPGHLGSDKTYHTVLGGLKKRVAVGGQRVISHFDDLTLRLRKEVVRSLKEPSVVSLELKNGRKELFCRKRKAS
jgi:hypothetical protein